MENFWYVYIIIIYTSILFLNLFFCDLCDKIIRSDLCSYQLYNLKQKMLLFRTALNEH